MTVHTRNIQILAIEIYKVKYKISPNFVRENFPQSDSAYNLRNTSDFKRTKVNTVLWGSAIYWTHNLGFISIEYKNNTYTNLIHIKSKTMGTSKLSM